MTSHRGSISSNRLKIVASVVLMVPATILLAFALGEMLGGDISGAQHLVQAAPLLLLLLASWRYPRVVGALLITVGTLTFAIWCAWVIPHRAPELREVSVLMWIGTAGTLFLPPLVAGWFLMRAGRIGR